MDDRHIDVTISLEQQSAATKGNQVGNKNQGADSRCLKNTWYLFELLCLPFNILCAIPRCADSRKPDTHDLIPIYVVVLFIVVIALIKIVCPVVSPKIFCVSLQR